MLMMRIKGSILVKKKPCIQVYKAIVHESNPSILTKDFLILKRPITLIV